MKKIAYKGKKKEKSHSNIIYQGNWSVGKPLNDFKRKRRSVFQAYT